MLAQHPDVQRQAREEAMAVTEEEMESGKAYKHLNGENVW